MASIAHFTEREKESFYLTYEPLTKRELIDWVINLLPQKYVDEDLADIKQDIDDYQGLE